MLLTLARVSQERLRSSGRGRWAVDIARGGRPIHGRSGGASPLGSGDIGGLARATPKCLVERAVAGPATLATGARARAAERHSALERLRGRALGKVWAQMYTYLPTCRSIYLPTYLSIYRRIDLST